jgi:hypothetical protein
LGFDSTQVEAGLMALKYDIGAGRARKLMPFKVRDTNPYTRVEKAFTLLVQSSIDQISKDLVEGINRQLQMNLRSDWTKKTQNLLSFNKQFTTDKDPFMTTAKPEMQFRSMWNKQEIIQETTIPCILIVITIAMIIQGELLGRYFDVIADYVEHKRIRKFSDKFSLVGRMRDAMAIDNESEETGWVWELLKRQLEDFDPIQCPQGDLVKRYIEHDPAIIKQIANKSCEYLEFIFCNELTNGSSVGESMSPIMLIDAYTKSTLKMGLKELSEKIEEIEVEGNGWPIFAIIYYLIRSGQWKEAIHYAKQSQYKPVLDFANLYQIYIECNNSLPNEELNQALHVLEVIYDTPMDPFKQALYTIITKQHKEPNRLLQPFMNDYLWFYLKIVTFDNEEELIGEQRTAYAPLNMTKFQQSILEMSKELNTPEKDPFSHFKTLLLVGLYDHAIKHLTNFTSYFSHCMHYAIVLNEVGVLPNAALFEANDIPDQHLEDTAVTLV